MKNFNFRQNHKFEVFEVVLRIGDQENRIQRVLCIQNGVFKYPIGLVGSWFTGVHGLPALVMLHGCIWI